MSLKNKNANVEVWDINREKIYSSVGGWIAGKDVNIRGYSMVNDLLGKVSYMQVLILNATGRLVESNLALWLEGNFIGMSYPDPRIWCNQIGALNGASRTSVTAATVAGVLAADSRAYGGSKTSFQGVSFIQAALKKYKKNISVKIIVEEAKRNKSDQPIITGYARPVDQNDERLKPHEEMTTKLGFETGEHLRLAYKVSEYLHKNYKLGMNIGGYTSAFLSDQGFSPEEVYQIKCMVVSSGVTACYINTKNRIAESFLPLRCEDIIYNGHAPRKLPLP